VAELALHTEVATIPDVPDASTFRVRGRATYRETPQLRELLLGHVESVSGSKLVIELSGVREIDTTGAAVLVEAVRAGHKKGLRMLLCSPSEPVMKIFELAGFEDALNCCTSSPAETKQLLLN
jgi:anti-anti-sigma factor